MDETYSVSTNNRFALFMDEEDDPGDVVLQESKLPEKSPKKVEAPIQKKTEKVAKIKETKEKPLGQQNKRSQGEVAGKRKDPSCKYERWIINYNYYTIRPDLRLMD